MIIEDKYFIDLNDTEHILETAKVHISAIENGHDITGYIPFAENNDYYFAIVFGYDNYENSGVLGKVAQLAKNSGMSEYDIDWIMPTDPKIGIVDDTEIGISGADDTENIKWLIECAKRFKETYV